MSLLMGQLLNYEVFKLKILQQTRNTAYIQSATAKNGTLNVDLHIKAPTAMVSLGHCLTQIIMVVSIDSDPARDLRC